MASLRVTTKVSVYISLLSLFILLFVSGQAISEDTYRWLDVADQEYSSSYRNTYSYDQAQISIEYKSRALTFVGKIFATNLKPNFAYQVKLVGTPGTGANERIGLVGRWWQEEWNGAAWVNGQNLNNKGDGSSPNPNDMVYYANKDIPHPTSPTGLKYKYTGYLVLDYFITDKNGDIEFNFEADSSYHVIWKTSQKTWTSSDGPIKSATFDADESAAYEDSGGDDFPVQTINIFGEWERLPVGGIFLTPGDYQVQFILTEESFHGSGGTYAGNWEQAISREVTFEIAEPASDTLHLLPGWNLITLPIIPESPYKAQSMLDDININQGGSCSEVDRWLNGGWNAHIEGQSFNDFGIEVGEGYFINCNEHSDWLIQGMELIDEVTHQLSVGWNLIGAPFPAEVYDAQSLLDKFSSEGATCIEVDRWVDGGWNAHINGFGFNNFVIESNQGYFIKCTLVVE